MSEEKIENAKKQRENEEFENARIKAAQEEEARRLYALQVGSPKPAIEEKEEKALDDDYQQIINAYQEQFPDRQLENDKEGRPVLRFNSPEEASQFFKKMSDQNCKFAAIEITPDGKPTGNMKVSFGKGEFYEPKINPEHVSDFLTTYNEWNKAKGEEKEELKSQLMEMMKPDYQWKKSQENPAKDMRASLRDLREMESTPPSPSSDLEAKDVEQSGNTL
ncbi:hypothetical protein E3983_03005 [Legionella israelensis]|uniref:Substrate of the Dot/Icm secretion system n=1 Tax=Legionella israelensis TaxID=454 RepID=A0AAX1EF17_9GAMM|nr:hypothetical protein [Legionella israelensis]QBR83424.1 hypothetical protein E3983_03005 [Legionella israelensis]